MGALLRRGYRWLGHGEEALAVALLVGIVVVVNVQVVGRYVLARPFMWSEELTRLLLVWLTFVAAAAVTRRGAHIAVDLLFVKLGRRAALSLQALIDLAMAGTFLWIAGIARRLAEAVAPLPLAATQWSMALMVWPAAVGLALIGLHALVRFCVAVAALVRGAQASDPPPGGRTIKT